jgi:hypothetical protein
MVKGSGAIFRAVILVVAVGTVTAFGAMDLCLPTSNDAILNGRDEDYFQPTTVGDETSGMFGCVRSGGRRFHEGIDIKSIKRDRKGESIDPVHAVSDGTVAFTNDKPGLSNYGRYVILEHRWDGVQVFTVYAHLREVADGLVAGQPVRKAQVIGVLGRSTNTREGIGVERAHLHFEVAMMLNTNFRIWYAKRDPKAPPFGNFNGQNFSGLDPVAFLRAYAADRKLNFNRYFARQPVAFTVLVGARPFPWLTMHPEQIQPMSAAVAGQAPVAYEVAVSAWGMPLAVWPRAASELTENHARFLSRGSPVVSKVNQPELVRTTCRRLVQQVGSGWELAPAGRDWVELLTFSP